MICPHCKKEITVNNGFCPECGLNISNGSDGVCLERPDPYWKNIHHEDVEHTREYKDLIDKEKRKVRTRKYKTLATTILTLVLSVVGVFGFVKFQQYQTQLVGQVKSELVGKTMTAHASHMEGFGWIYHQYWQLTFLDESSLDFAYIETVGPAEDDDQPKYQGTYAYKVSRSITGKYSIKVNGATYELKVSNENIPQSISR